MLIELLEDWTNGDQEWAKEMTLDTETDADGLELIEKGIAKEVKRPETQQEMDNIDALSMEKMQKMIDASIRAYFDQAPPMPTKKIGKLVHDNSDDDEEYFKTGGFSRFGNFLQDVYRADEKQNISKELDLWNRKTAGIMSVSDDTEGGYLVPEQFNATLLSTMIEDTIIRQRAQFVPMATNTITYPAIVCTSHASSLFGGIIIYRTDEGNDKSGSKPNFGKVQLTLHNLTGLVYVTNQLLEDSPISIEPLIYDLFGRAIAWWEDEDFINGTGAGQAMGVLNAPCLIAQAKEGDQAPDTVIYENVIKMWARLHPRSRKNAIWLVDTQVLPQLFQMTLAVGTGGLPVYLPPGGASGSPYGNLLGRPVIDTEHMQVLGDEGDILLGDWSQYLIGGKAGGGIRTAVSSHIRFVQNEMAYRIETRYDGQPWWTSALTPKRGTAGINDLSPFVALADRA